MEMDFRVVAEHARDRHAHLTCARIDSLDRRDNRLDAIALAEAAMTSWKTGRVIVL